MSDGTEQTSVPRADEQALRRATVRAHVGAATNDLVGALYTTDDQRFVELITAAKGHLTKAEAEILKAPLG